MTDPSSPTPEYWACVDDETDVYQLKLASKAEALTTLGSKSGEVLRYARGYPRGNFEKFFDPEKLLVQLEEHACNCGEVLADFEDGVFDVGDSDLDALRRHLAEAVMAWIRELNPVTFVILEREAVEVPTDAKNTAP